MGNIWKQCLDFIVKFIPNHRVYRTLKKKVNVVFYYRGPVRGSARVPRLNFTASYVAISEHSRVACRNFNNNFLVPCQSDNPHSLQRR